MTQDAEDVEDVVAVVGQGERMDDGVEADGKQGEGHECAENENTGK